LNFVFNTFFSNLKTFKFGLENQYINSIYTLQTPQCQRLYVYKVLQQIKTWVMSIPSTSYKFPNAKDYTCKKVYNNLKHGFT
jgi:hypothetical protein